MHSSQNPLDLADARQIVAAYVMHYNQHCLHSGIGYVTPQDKLEGREQQIFAERKTKLEEAKKRRIAAHKNTPVLVKKSLPTASVAG